MGYTEAVKRAVETIAGDGVVITYPSGKTDTIETATLRAVRTGVSQTAAQITLQRAQENGVDLVVTSSHLGARPTHEPWQGKVFHVDYDTAMREKFRKRDSPPPTPKTTSDKYPDFVQSTRYGYVDGLCGANCRHSFYPHIEGVSHNPFEQFDSEENKKRYEAEQQQRALERAIRKSKRKCEGLKTAADNADEATRPAMQEAYGKAAAKLRAQNAEYKQFCEDNGLKTRQDRVSIAGWDRKQAAQARAAENEIRKKSKKPIANEPQNRIIKGESGDATIRNIEQPIEQRTAPYGKPSAVAYAGIQLSKRQEELLGHLSEYNAKVTVPKKSVRMADLSALTAQTGVEFALFTKGNERLVLRGDETHVEVNMEMAIMLAEKGYRWSGHTHPGFDYNCLFASDGDIQILKCFRQEFSSIYNSSGGYNIFGKE